LKKSVRQLLMKIYAGRADAHLDLYRLSNQHRRKHGRSCDMYPSDPLQAPLWTVIASLTNARRILEVGCGHGYTAAVMASAARPDCRVDTVEADPDHADLAERAFQDRGLSTRIRVLRGRGQEALLKLKGHYDVVFLDGDWREYPRYLPYLRRLTRPGSILVTANLSPLFGGWGGRLPGKPAIQSYLTRLVRDPHFRTYVVPGEWHSISVRVECPV
jgi:predicted O-methyltransferase YrrM